MNQDTDTWIGRTIEAEDIISTERAFALWASLDSGEPAPQEGSPLPPLWHWLYFWVVGRRSELGRDGQAALGGFLPALGEVRRMWAGSRVTFLSPLILGQTAHRRITIVDVEGEGRKHTGCFFSSRRFFKIEAIVEEGLDQADLDMAMRFVSSIRFDVGGGSAQ